MARRSALVIDYTFRFRVPCPTCGAQELHAGLSPAEEPLVYCPRCHGQWWVTFTRGTNRTLADLVLSIGRMFRSIKQLAGPEGEVRLRAVRPARAPLGLGDGDGSA